MINSWKNQEEARIFTRGSFERYLKQDEELRAINIKRERKTTTKVTITTIISDIPRIESLLLNKRMNNTIDMKIASRQIEDSLGGNNSRGG